MSCGIAIFVKTPGLSPIKTRLAASVGLGRALTLYRGCVDCVRASVELACAEVDLTAYWAVAEPEGLAQWAGWPCLVQPEGGLGTRMAGIHAQLRARHHGALLLGADVPALSATLIEDACRALDGAPARVIAPAKDGGFVLFGANADLGDDRWDGPAYGAPDTADQFLSSVGRQLSLTRLPYQQDLDVQSDLSGLLPPAAPTAEQQSFWTLFADLVR